jgi:putative ABC transport system permease protein
MLGDSYMTSPALRSEIDITLQDVRFALRQLARRPGFAATVLATLALGIGASTAIFSVVDGILLRPLPFAQPERLVVLNELRRGRMTMSWANFADHRERSQSYESVTCYHPFSFTVVDPGQPRRLPGRMVCGNFFDVLGVRPQLGRTFTRDDDQLGATPVVLVSDRFWRQELGGDPAILGQTIRTLEHTFTVVGVLPPDFHFVRPESIFAPLGLIRTQDSGWLDRGNHFSFYGLGRLRIGVSLTQARTEADRIAADLRREHPGPNGGYGAEVSPLADRLVEDVKDTLVTLMGAVSFLLLLACVNVSNLLVARGAARQHELAIRSALGGSRWRLVRQLLAESALLSFAGGALGVVLAAWLLETFVGLAPPGIPRIEMVRLDRASLLFALGASTMCGLVFGAFPALQASGWRGQPQLARASRSSAAVAPRRTRRALMVIEVALALVLLAGCGLMARTMSQLYAVEPGFEPEGLLTGQFTLAGDAWNSEDRRRAFFDSLLERVAQIPGVETVGLTMSLPIDGSNWGSVFTVADKPVPRREELPSAAFNPVSRDYFATMGIPVLEGRPFDNRDGSEAPRVAVINRTLAERLWPGESPIGKRLKQGWPETPETSAPWREVVGVVADVKLLGVDRDTPMHVYLPLDQRTSRALFIVARTSIEPHGIARDVEGVVRALDKEVPLTRVLSMTDVMRNSFARRRLSTLILTVFAGVAILLAAVGLYGVVSHNVTERTREIGVRMALGANRRQVAGMFVRNGVVTAVAGTVLGLAGALVLARWLQTLLFRVEPTDPWTLASVAILLIAVAAVACYVPARRAARVDPIVALRE